MDNYRSAINRRPQVEKQLRDEIAEGRYIICQDKPPLVSALGAIDKPNGGIRLITDCSQPEGAGALNEYANSLLHTKYQTVDDAVDIINKYDRPFLAKADLKSAYRSVQIHEDDYKFTGLKWNFTGQSGDTYFYDTAMCFGAKRAPGIFHRLTQAVRRMMLRRGFESVVYLDDFLLICPTEEKCAEGLNILLQLLRGLGFAIAWDKLVSPTTCLTFLGIKIDSARKVLSLPEDKVKDMSVLLASFKQKKRASLKQLQQLAGKLAWFSRVIFMGRTYLQRVLNIMLPLKRANHKVLLTTEFQQDIKWWIGFMNSFNFKHMVPMINKTVTLESDSCSHGAGVLIRNFDWLHVNWKRDYPAVANMHINVKEAMSVVAGIYRWAPLLQDSLVVIETDNVYTKAVINKGACRNEFLMGHLRNLGWLSAMYNFKLHCKHVSGICNYLADSLSRVNDRGHMLYWFSTLSQGRPYNLSDVLASCLGHVSPLTLRYLVPQARLNIPW